MPNSPSLLSSELSQSLGPRQLHALMHFGEPLHVFDVRRSEAFASDPTLIEGAQRLVPWVIPAHMGALRAKGRLRHRLVMVCVYGHAVSQTAAVIARCHGLTALYLEGGMMGWREQELPIVPYQDANSWMSVGRTRAVDEEGRA